MEYEIKQMLNNDFAINDPSLISLSQSTPSLLSEAAVATTSTDTSSIPKSSKKTKPTTMEAFLNGVDSNTIQQQSNTPRASMTEEFHNYRLLIAKYYGRHKASTSLCLNFWQTYQATFPLLSQVAIQFVCTPATSVPSESAFSISAYVGRKERARLSVQSLAATVFLKVRYQR